MSERSSQYRCSFCGKSQEQLDYRLIMGPQGIEICNECVALCVAVFEMEREESPPPARCSFCSHEVADTHHFFGKDNAIVCDACVSRLYHSR